VRIRDRRAADIRWDSPVPDADGQRTMSVDTPPNTDDVRLWDQRMVDVEACGDDLSDAAE